MYVDALGGGHGPFDASTPQPAYGYADLWDDAGQGHRYRGDMIGDSGGAHVGYTVTSTVGVRWVFPSANSTYTLACAYTPTGPAYDPCQGQYPAPVHINSGATPQALPFAAAAVIIGYLSICPSTSGEIKFHQCVGTTVTPIDGSGYVTAIIADGFVSPGLPYGHPLTNPNANSLAGDCVADLVAYGPNPPGGQNLVNQFTVPPGYLRGTRVAAVYTCP